MNLINRRLSIKIKILMKLITHENLDKIKNSENTEIVYEIKNFDETENFDKVENFMIL